jgi:xylose isomerase
MDRADLFHGHIGGIDTLAQSLLAAARILEDGALERARDQRYAGWDGPLGTAIMDGSLGLAGLEQKVSAGNIDPRPVSGRQEHLENLINRGIWQGTVSGT